MGAMLVDMTLEVVVNLLLQHSRAGVAEYPDRDLAVVVVGTLDIHEDFDVTRFSVARNDAGNLEIRGRFARGFRSDLRNSANSKSVFNHDCDPYMRSGGQRSHAAKEFTRTLHGRLRDGYLNVGFQLLECDEETCRLGVESSKRVTDRRAGR
jgi:hypothetical protein